MRNKLLLFLCLILAVQSAVVSTETISRITAPIATEIVRQPSVVSDTIIRAPIILTQEAEVYSGNVEINIQNGEDRRIDFYGTFVPNNNNCSYSRCYVGWVDNYTISGEDNVVGFNNQTLAIKPVFEFRTNSETDFVIVRHPNLAEEWVQIIEILCEKINPQITQRNPTSQKAYSTAQTINFQSRTSNLVQDFSLETALPTSDKIDQPEESLLPQYNFRTIQASDLQSQSFSSIRFNSNTVRLAIGDQVATSQQKINLQGFQAQDSLFTETLVLSRDNLVKTRNLNYKIQLDSSGQLSDKGQKVPDFAGLTTLNFAFSGKIQTPTNNLIIVQRLLSEKSRSSFDLKAINQRRARLAQIWDPSINVVVDEGPTFEEAEILTFNNEKFSGINVVDELNKVSAASPSLTLNTGVLSNVNLGRNLQTLLQNYTVYNYKKVLLSKTIFGKTFSADVEVKCYVLVYSNDHQIQCVGSFNYQLFGKVKSITIFNFKKSVSFSWNWSKQYSGKWDFSVAIPLPPPVSFISITFSFKVSYVINVNINIVGGQGVNPYQVKANVLATTKVDTDAAAGVRVIAIEGGVFIAGTLVNAGTDPKVTLSYYFTKKYINILAQWYFWLNAFNYKWGFYYRTWSLWSGWSGRKIIKQWTINGVYGKWTIVNKSWNVYL